MRWLNKIWFFFLGCVYAITALVLALLFVPGLIGLFLLLLSVCMINVSFYKHVTGWSFEKASTLVIFLTGKAAESFRRSENATYE